MSRKKTVKLSQAAFFSMAISVSMFFCNALNALPDDRKKTLIIYADSASFSEKTGQVEYKGHVKLEQGTVVLTANRIIIQQTKRHELESAKAFGSIKTPAHYCEKIEENRAFLHAFADEIEYQHKKHLITLLKNARLIHGKESLKAPVIQYDTEKRELITKNISGQQTEIILEKGRLR